MIKYIIIGSGFAFAAAVQPGPLMAFLLSRVSISGWRRTLPAAFAPVISDGPIAILVLLVLNRFAGGFEHILKAAGGILLLYFAGSTLAAWRREKTGTAMEASIGPEDAFSGRCGEPRKSWAIFRLESGLGAVDHRSLETVLRSRNHIGYFILRHNGHQSLADHNFVRNNFVSWLSGAKFTDVGIIGSIGEHRRLSTAFRS